ncbi:phosphoglycerate kinase [Williamsia sp. 1138]|uniref:histidine phosphatase family protein n=1 Tax=Williamsia sp. 1138 TaxID=1903117 RepID=UPI000A112DB8|nr:histidine phosphatase family protein [Williamsia sp. 1138]OZG28591.1 phosphoglycerate kinase [Williamsia sp. 1138]
MTVILLRHGRSTANTSGVLAGRTPGVDLDEHGRAQAAAIVERIAAAGTLAAVVRSPLQRCEQTVLPLVQHLGVEEIVEERLLEVDYGQWSGRPIKELLSEPLWRVVQQQPSAAIFPGGEGLAQVQARAVSAVRELDARFSGEDGAGVWVACTHGDVIKAVLADAMGMHLDSFQRIVVEPASMSVVRYSVARPYVHAVNCTSTLQKLGSAPKHEAKTDEKHADEAVVGGSTGT